MGRITDVKYLRVGQCRHLECIAAQGGRFASVEFPSLCGLIHHSDIGWILFDTGYAEHFFIATKKLPQRLYSLALPVDLPQEQTLISQLRFFGITPEDISLVIVSHYHGDHVAGLRDFPRAKFIAMKAATEEIQKFLTRPWRATLQGKLPHMLPDDYFVRLNYVDNFKCVNLPQWMSPLAQAFDLLGDGSLLGIPLPGHSSGQLGLLLPDALGRPVFFVADACWSLPACREGRMPSSLINFLTHNRKAYSASFMAIKQLAEREPAMAILPSHCVKTWKEFNGE